MELVYTVFWAMSMNFLGFLAPGMMNMTAVKVSMEHSKKQAFQFVFGTTTIIVLQAAMAISFSKFLLQNNHIIDYLTYVGVIVLFLLSFLFYKQAKNSDVKSGLTNGTFLSGIKMAGMNMMAIPFFVGYSTMLEHKQLIHNQLPNNIFFVIGAGLGFFIIMTVYIYFAQIIQKKASSIAKNINGILAVLFLVLGIVALVKIAIDIV